MTVSVQDIAQKLKKLEGFPERVREFGKFLAGYISKQDIDPERFVIEYDAALETLRAGTDCCTKEPVLNSLCGCKDEEYRALQMELPNVARAIFSKEFAAEVIAIHNKTEEYSKNINGGAH